MAVEAEWQGHPPRLNAPVSVESRAGCDLDPPRVASDEDMRLLEAFVWADQPERLEALRAAVQVARDDPPRVDVARAGEWRPVELDAAPEGCCSVVFHSSVWLYIPAAEQAAIRELIENHGARAVPPRPLAWLRHEDGEIPGTIEIRLRLWPGDGEDLLLGMGHPHGRHVEWF